MQKNIISKYIYILIFLIAFVFCIVFIYDSNVDSVNKKNAVFQTESYLKTQISSVEEAISKYELKFFEGSNEVNAVTTKEGYNDVFNGNKYIICESSNIESLEGEYNLYIKSDSSIGKVSLDTLLSSVESESPIFLVLDDCKVVGKNKFYSTDNFSDIINYKTNDTKDVENVCEALKGDKGYYSNLNIYVTEDEVLNGYIGIEDYLGLNFVSFLSSNMIKSSNGTIEKFRIVMFILMPIILIGAAVCLARIIIISNKSNAVEAGINYQTANIVLSIRGSGKIIKYNKTFKLSFPGHKVPIRSINELKNLDSSTRLFDLIRAQKKVRLIYSPKNGENNEDIVFDLLSIKCKNYYILVGRVITKEYEYELDLIKTSCTSNVTGDENAFMFERRYQQLKDKYKSLADPYIIVMANLKGFKDVNALLGFKAGNDVLSYFSKRLNEKYEGHSIYHINADEFIVACESSDETNILKITEELTESLKAPININNNEIMLRPAFAVFGCAMDKRADNTYELLIEKLRLACDKAKANPNHPICKYDDNIENAALKHREMEEDLKHAIGKNEFVMFYQPQYEITQGRVCGFEALLRWNNPKYANISPQVYIEMAEKNGYIIDVGNFITKDVLKTAKEMEQYNIHISLNVSPAQIVQAGFVADLLDLFEKNNLQPGSIALEVTETFLMENFQTVIDKLKILKNRGISIHLDDFGTGYSSMLYLKELPVDTIKVDKEFIKHIETDRFSKILTSKIISLAKELGDKVICEGVETKVQKDIVGKFGADIIQGYYIGKPLSKEDAFGLLKTGKVSNKNMKNGNAGE